MKVRLDFIDSTWCGKVIEVDKNCIYKIDGESAMNMLFEQEHNEHKDIVVFYKRKDLPYIYTQAGGHMQISVFAADNFSWYYIFKDYLLMVLGVVSNV